LKTLELLKHQKHVISKIRRVTARRIAKAIILSFFFFCLFLERKNKKGKMVDVHDYEEIIPHGETIDTVISDPVLTLEIIVWTLFVIGVGLLFYYVKRLLKKSNR
jgi:hypothetical protein